jgi:hypothetical protein
MKDPLITIIYILTYQPQLHTFILFLSSLVHFPPCLQCFPVSVGFDGLVSLLGWQIPCRTVLKHYWYPFFPAKESPMCCCLRAFASSSLPKKVSSPFNPTKNPYCLATREAFAVLYYAENFIVILT